MNNTSVVNLAFAVASAALVTTSQKADAFTMSGDWSYRTTSHYAGVQTFYDVMNQSGQKAFDFHIEYSDDNLRREGKKRVQDYLFPDGIESGAKVAQISFTTIHIPGNDGNFHAYWTDKNHAPIVKPVPEPATILGLATVLGFMPLLNKGHLRTQKKAKNVD